MATGRTKTQQVDMLATRHPLSPQASRQSRRSRIACLDCRRRKVRCNVAVYGRPCTNCRLDGFECITRPGNPRNSRIPADNTSMADIPRASNSDNSHDECTATSITTSSQMSGLGASEMNSLETQRDGTIPADAGALQLNMAPNTCSCTFSDFSSDLFLDRLEKINHLREEKALLEPSANFLNRRLGD